MRQIIIDDAGVVSSVFESNLLQDGATTITDEALWLAVKDKAGRVKLLAGIVVAIEPPAPPARPARTYKADIWRRVTDEEAATIDAQLSAQPIKLRNLYRDAQYLDHADPYFAELKAGFVDIFGAERAAAILAPSE